MTCSSLIVNSSPFATPSGAGSASSFTDAGAHSMSAREPSWNVFPNAAFPASSSLSGGSSVGGRGALLLLLSSANESGS